MDDWDQFFQEMEAFVCSLDRFYGLANESFTEYAIERLEVCIVGVIRLKENFQPVSRSIRMALNSEELQLMEHYKCILTDLVVCLRELARKWSQEWDRLNIPSTMYTPQSMSASRGRPKFDIKRNQLEYLEDMSFNWTQIAQILGVSRTTIYRRRLELSMNTSSPRSNVSDDELELVIRQIHSEAPTLGERMIMGKLRSIGVRVSRARVRTCIRRVDPINTALRWRGNLVRRQPYSVAGPNSLWHIGE